MDDYPFMSHLSLFGFFFFLHTTTAKAEELAIINKIKVTIGVFIHRHNGSPFLKVLAISTSNEFDDSVDTM